MKTVRLTAAPIFLLLGCTLASAQTGTPPPALPDAPSTISSVAPPPQPTGPTVIFDTSMGRMTCKLFSRQAPVATANFTGLAEGTKDWVDPTTQKTMHGVPFYNGTTFHRVIPNFMIQGGDRVGDGTGDAGFMFPNEVQPNLTFDVPGRLAMANAGPDTNGTQFFITEVPEPDLNGNYTIFGQCDSQSIVVSTAIARVERDSHDKPLTPVKLNKVTVVRDGQSIPPDPYRPAEPAPASPPAPAIPVQTMPAPH